MVLRTIRHAIRVGSLDRLAGRRNQAVGLMSIRVVAMHNITRDAERNRGGGDRLDDNTVLSRTHLTECQRSWIYSEREGSHS